MPLAVWVVIFFVFVGLVGLPLLMAYMNHTGRWTFDDTKETKFDRWLRRHPRLALIIPPSFFFFSYGGLTVRYFIRGDRFGGYLYLFLTIAMTANFFFLAVQWRKAANRKFGDEDKKGS